MNNADVPGIGDQPELKSRLRKRPAKKQMTFDDFKSIKAVKTQEKPKRIRKKSKTAEKVMKKSKKVVKVLKKDPIENDVNIINSGNDSDDDDDNDNDNSNVEIIKKTEKIKDLKPATHLKLLNNSKKNFMFNIPLTLKPDFNEQSILSSNWSPNCALTNEEFIKENGLINNDFTSKLKSKLIPYAGDIIKVMSFINKFHFVFSTELINISFQEFEIGLNLYPEEYDENTLTDEKPALYENNLPPKDIIIAQDKMNLLFLTMLKLLFLPLKTDNQPHLHRPYASMNNIRSKEAFVKLVRSLRYSVFGWGLPKEWRINNATINSESYKNQENMDDSEEEIKPELANSSSTPSLLDNSEKSSDNAQNEEELQYGMQILENIPVFNPQLAKIGILGLEPRERIILLRAMVDWCTAHSPKIHNEIYRLTHFKKEPAFGVPTQHASRFLIDGVELTYLQFEKLCSLFIKRYERKHKRKGQKGQLDAAKKEELERKMIVLKEIQDILKVCPKEEKQKTSVSLYNKWIEIFEGDINDNPLSSPFEDELYKIRESEFFVGRMPSVGDFYVPIMSTYFDRNSPLSLYKDIRNLNKLFKRFSKDNTETNSLLKHMKESNSKDFRLFFYDTYGVVNDLINNSTSDKTYWYEIANNSETLKNFIQTLEKQISGYKSDVKASKINQDDFKLEILIYRIEILRDYLNGLYSIFRQLEILASEFADVQLTSRTLRRSQRRDITTNKYYNNGGGSDEEILSQKEEVHSKSDEETYNEEYFDEEDLAFDNTDQEYEKTVKRQKTETREERFRRRLTSKNVP
ncbi:hypothetical protein Kpol_295p4 [Vanderwaltozyma polyspora DSM 70294]|uniref:WHIM1 domain-containing protein n=1 Tax=Vanderwaltozyma polyspora (strain ATCC 22028 / DSM 70294 / BCRC 21397 / CBS 2163 / NBRC 10782 / NRRL Y-8283 / UCD 57-17) TaxID=436907 RepID=A7TT18_VANPO|nr:uncharacterized protein Kpol_295p4 [Vanderwaltozyma polyspora DSM 70294]EDO14588.1 hypothetical protein Kpol_295p4 [Vanderwaltozyma polyspora DSM 70294]